MPQTVAIFMRPDLRQAFTDQVGGLPRGLRFAGRLERSHVVIDAFEEVDMALVGRALEAALPTALVSDDLSAGPVNSVISAISSAVGRRKRLALMVAPARAALRVALARLNSAEDKLIAHATLVVDEIRVWSCEPRAYQCTVAAIKALARLPRAQLEKFEISASGSRIHWHGPDVDLALDDFREVCDQSFARKQQQRVAEDLVRYGKAIRALRTEHGLRQAGIKGLSDRQLRRIEQGKHSPQVDTLRKLAKAHRMPLKSYLDALAARN